MTVGLDQDITSKSKIYKSLKNYFPFQPPKINIFVPFTKLAECPNLAEGAPEPKFYDIFLFLNNFIFIFKNYLYLEE